MMTPHAFFSLFVPGLFAGVLLLSVPALNAAAAPPGAPGMEIKAPAVAAGKVFRVDALPGRRYSARIVSPAVVSITSLARVRKLWEQNAESRDAYDAALLAAEANETPAQDDLKHAVIAAPSDGRAGVAALPVGSWVSSSSGALTTVVALIPCACGSRFP